MGTPALSGAAARVVANAEAWGARLPASLRFEEDVWNLAFRSTIAGSPSSHKISFTEFPEPWRDDVKAFITQALLDARSNSWILSTLGVLRWLLRILQDRSAASRPPAMLTADDARAVEEWFATSGREQARAELTAIAEFAAFLRRQHRGNPAHFRPSRRAAPPDRRGRAPFTEGLERVIPDEVSRAFMAAVARHEAMIERIALTARPKSVLSVRLYLQICKLLVFTGRRISELLLVVRQPLQEPTDEERAHTGPGVWFAYNDTKSRQGAFRVFVPEPGAAIVRGAVGHAQALTEDLAARSGLNRLFLTERRGGANGGGQARTVSASAFRLWLNGRMTDDWQIIRPGFVHREAIVYQGAYYPIEPHQTRHTLAHKAYLGGASYLDVGDHLGHRRTAAGLSPMTAVYIHGRQREVLQVREMHERRRHHGTTAPLTEHRVVVTRDPDEDAVTRWGARGWFLLPSYYGHCLLPPATGPCSASDPRLIGPDGRASDYRLESSEARAALAVDRRLLAAGIAYLDNRYPDLPQLDAFRARLAQLDQLLPQAASKLSPGLEEHRPPTTGDPTGGRHFDASKPFRSAMRERRRQNALRSSPFARRRRLPAASPRSLTPEEMSRAEAFLDAVEAERRPLWIRTLARSLGVSTLALQNTPTVFRRVVRHSQPLDADEEMAARLKALWLRGERATYKEFAALCGRSLRNFFLREPAWCRRLKAHNRSVRQRAIRVAAERRLQRVLASERPEPLRRFAVAIHTDVTRLRSRHRDITRRLVAHNRRLGLRGAHRPRRLDAQRPRVWRDG
ncbi:MAG: hypothetical protein HYU41_13365 [Candidatus Rokubacteria bacterium]|nr:hypothetical protein [Candidatus Rokubacteria bacterium]